MVSIRAVAVTMSVVVAGAQPLAAGDLTAYRAFTLGSSVATVATISATRAQDVKTLHTRPSRIQTLEWRAPYLLSGQKSADPVRDVLFSFSDDQLFQIVVNYDRERTEGLTNDDVIGSLAAVYGPPVPVEARAPGVAADLSDAVVLARWDDASSQLTLTRSTYSRQFQAVFVSKALNARALAAIKEALRLDTQDAPQRALDLRNKQAAEAASAAERARVVNKPAFRP